MTDATPDEFSRALERLIAYWSKLEIVAASGFTPTKEWFDQYHTKNNPGVLPTSKEFWHLKTAPFSDEVLAVMVAIRDEKLLDAILELWEAGKSIVVVYGLTHTSHLEPALEKLTGTQPIVVA